MDQPMDKPCVYRGFAFEETETGAGFTARRCIHIGHHLFGKVVSPEICHNCQLREETVKEIRPRLLEDGSIAYPSKGWEPPPDIEGYRRKPGDPWIFEPTWKQCEHRKQKEVKRLACGCITYEHFCGLDGELATRLKCETCRHI